MVHEKTNACHDVAPANLERDPIFHGAVLDCRLHKHLNVLALAVLAAGFGLRVFVASRGYLTADEALDYLIVNQSSAFLAYKASLTNAHPPLIYLVLYLWHFLGRSELMLRLPSVIAGTAFCWMVYKWLGLVFGRTASWIGLILVTFSPAMVALSAEVRPYALMLFCMGSSLYFLEHAFAEKSVAEMWRFSFFLFLAILSHYSVVFFALTVGVYALARVAASHLPRRVAMAWAGGQAGAIVIYGFLYVTHVSKIRKDVMATWKSPFNQYFFHWGQGHLLTFTRDQTSSIFRYLFENEYVSQAMLLFFVAGAILLLARDLLSHHKGNSSSIRLGLLLLLPFIAVWGADIAGIYPYVAGRHTAFLAPFAIAGLSYSLVAVFGRKLWAVSLIGGLIVLAAWTSGLTYEPYIKPENQARALMNGAINYIRQSATRNDLILVDMQGGLVIAYYLCDPADTIKLKAYEGFNKFSCGGYSVVSTNFHIWKFRAETFSSLFAKMALTYGLEPGDRVLVFQAGAGAYLDTGLPWVDLKFRCLRPAMFGENITVIALVVGADMSPALPRGSPHLTRLGPCSN